MKLLESRGFLVVRDFAAFPAVLLEYDLVPHNLTFRLSPDGHRGAAQRAIRRDCALLFESSRLFVICNPSAFLTVLL